MKVCELYYASCGSNFMFLFIITGALTDKTSTFYSGNCVLLLFVNNANLKPCSGLNLVYFMYKAE